MGGATKTSTFGFAGREADGTEFTTARATTIYGCNASRRRIRSGSRLALRTLAAYVFNARRVYTGRTLAVSTESGRLQYQLRRTAVK